MNKLVKLTFILTLCLPAFGQTWYTVVPASTQSMTLSASLPAGTTYRFVSLNGKATAPVTIAAAQMVSSFGVGADPDPGVAKSMQVLRSGSFSVFLIDSSVKPTKITPVPVPPLPGPTVVLTYTGCTINLMSDGTFSTVAGTCAVKK